MKRILSTVLSLVMLISIIMPAGISAAADEKDTIINGFMYELNATKGVLTIKGYSDYDYEGAFYTYDGFLEDVKDIIMIKSIKADAEECINSVRSVIVSNGVTIFDPYCFSDLKNMEEITIPSTVLRIPHYAFKGCDALKTVNYGGTKAQWDKIVINTGNDNLINADFNYSVNVPTIGYSQDFINSVSMNTKDNTYISFGSGRFYYYKGLLDINGKGKISYSTGFNHDLSSYISFSDYEFNNGSNYVTDTVIGNNVTALGKQLFAYFVFMNTVTIPKSVTAIDEKCFYNCKSLTDVYYYGTAKDWSKIKIGKDNEPLKKAKIHYLPAPGNIKSLKASSIAAKSITLSWAKSSNARGYTIDKYNAADKKWVRVATTSATSYKIPVTPGCKYKFRVRAYRTVNDNKKLYSAYSYLETASRPTGTSIKSLSAGKGKFTVKWKKQPVRTTGYIIEYSTNKDFKNAVRINVANPNATSKTVSGLTKGKKYYVRIKTYKAVKINGKAKSSYSYRTEASCIKVK